MVKFSGHIKIANLWLATVNTVEHDERIDFEVSEVEVDIDAIQTNQEIDEGVFFLGWDVFEESIGNDVTRWEWLVDRDVEG